MSDRTLDTVTTESLQVLLANFALLLHCPSIQCTSVMVPQRNVSMAQHLPTSIASRGIWLHEMSDALLHIPHST